MGNRPVFSANPFLGTCLHSGRRGEREKIMCSLNPFTKNWEISSSKTKVKPKEVLDFEKKNAGKKKIKVRDGSVN